MRKKLSLNKRKLDNRVYIVTETDDVLDILNEFPKADKDVMLQAFDSNEGLDSSVIFSTDNNIYGFIYKFAKEGDTGLVAAFSRDKKKLADKAKSSFENIHPEASEKLYKKVLELEDVNNVK
jgi:hypothetical protein